MVNIPTPVGGLPLTQDTAPSALFAALFGLTIPLVIYRFARKESRNLLLIGSAYFTLERTVTYSLRAAQSANSDLRSNTGLLGYIQASFAIGFIGIGNDMIPLFRCLLVEATKPDAEAGREDRPELRKMFRQWSSLAGLAFLGATLASGVAGGAITGAVNDQGIADYVFSFRYIATAIGLLFTLVTLFAILRASQHVEHIDKRMCYRLAFIAVLMSTVGIYRLVVMQYRIPDLLHTGPGSLTSPGAKAAFYVLHVLPEWIAILIMFGHNTRKDFKTGLAGDNPKRRWWKKKAAKEVDEKPPSATP